MKKEKEGPPKSMVDDILKSFGDAEVETYTYISPDGQKGWGWRRKGYE